jgi:hypothetical protein
MAFQLLLVHDGYWEVRCASHGPITHIERLPDGSLIQSAKFSRTASITWQ